MIQSPIPPYLLFLMAFAASVVGTRAVLGYLRKKAILDQPNERSSHTIPTPRGGGLALTPVVLIGLALFLFGLDQPIEGVEGTTVGLALLAAAGLGLVCWVDDRRGLGALPRFLSQIIAVTLVLVMLPSDLRLFEALPFPLERVLMGLGWIWFINLFNFMDGIDGITGVQTAWVGLGLFFLGTGAIGNSQSAGLLASSGLILAGAALGFLVFNWHPAKLFLGDVGSQPIGFILGFLLIILASQGALVPALILVLYYLTDASLTLVRRLIRGEKIWQAHREHGYQRAVIRGHRHNVISGLVALVAGLLMAMAVWAIESPLMAFSSAALLVGLFMAFLLGPLDPLMKERGPDEK